MHALALLTLVPLLATGTPVSVVGQAALTGDRAQAEERAKRDARRQALERGAGVAVQSNTVVRNFALVADVISTDVTGVITDESWGRAQLADGTVRIPLRARVETALLPGHACRVLRAHGEPTIAVLAADAASVEPKSAIVDQLVGGCARIIHVALEPDEEGRLGGAMARARDLDAEYLVVVTRADSTSVARVIALDNNMALGTSVGSAASVADVVFSRVAVVWNARAAGSTRVDVELSGAGFTDARNAARAIAELAGAAPVEDVTMRDSVARFTIVVDGGGEVLAERVEGRPFQKRVLRVLEATPGRVALELASE